MIVLDYTTRIAPAALHAAGVSGVCRYISEPQPRLTKRIGLAEYRELLGAGIGVTLNWEYDSNDWLGGAGRGAAHGAEAVRQARALGYPPGSVIPGSCDLDMTRSQWTNAGEGYARAFATAVRAGGYRPGVYGPWDVLTWVRDAGLMDAFWQAGMSTSWSGGRNAHAWPGAHLRQRRKVFVAGQETDLNDILIPNWGQPQEEVDDDMSWGTDPLMQGTPGYAGQQHDTALAFAWQAANEAAKGVARLEAAQAAESTTVGTLLQLLQSATAGDGSLDTAAVKATIAAEHETTRALLVEQHTAEMAALKADHDAELAGLRAELAAAGG